MGLIKAMGGSTRGVLADSWRDFFYCESLDASTLASKGQKKTGNPDRSSNAKGDENVISNGSIVAINDGQCMIIVESGAVVDLCAEPGEYLYETSSEPSVFYGPLGANVKSTFKEMQRRIGFGGSPGKDQRVTTSTSRRSSETNTEPLTPFPSASSMPILALIST